LDGRANIQQTGVSFGTSQVTLHSYGAALIMKNKLNYKKL